MLTHFQPSAFHLCTSFRHVSVHTHHYLLHGCAAVRHRDAFVDEALVGAFVLVEDLLDRQAAFKHLHLFLLLQCHL